MIATVFWGLFFLTGLWLFEKGGAYLQHMRGCLIFVFLAVGILLGLLLHDPLLSF